MNYPAMAANVPATFVTGGNNDFLGGGGGIGALLIGALLFGGGFGGFGRGAGVDAAVLNPQFNSVQSQLNSLSDSLNNQTVLTQSANQYIGIQNTADNNARLISTQINDVATAQASANFTTLSSLNGAVGTLTNQNYNNALTTLNSFNGLNTTILQGINEIGRDQANYNNLILSQMQAQNMQSAQCCCDLKNSIHADGEATRALINSINLQNLQTQLSDAKNQISDLNQTNVLIANNALQTQTILQHLRPFPIVA